MKKNIQITFCACLGIILLLMFSCKKQELAVENPPNVIDLVIKGTTLTDTLEFLKDGKVIGQTDSQHGDLNVKVLVQGPDAELKIRRKGQSAILNKRTISAEQKLQNIEYYFDGDKIFSKVISLSIKGYSGADELEFVIDGKVLSSGSNIINSVLNIGAEANQKRELQIRKKGTTVTLMSKEITSEQATIALAFYYDGTKMYDKIDLAVPVNPANMMVNASFATKLDIFRGPVDLIFYTGKSIGMEAYQFSPTTLRIELPADGSFSKNIELPPLPDSGTSNKNVYSFRVVKRGTLTERPYDMTNEFPPSRPESGFYSGNVTFTAGGTAVFILSDMKIPDDWDGTNARPTMTDIAPYFK
jgi:hypothetical protein